MRDFSLTAYDALLTAMRRTGRPVLPLREYFGRRPAPEAFFILRHDVDRRPGNALAMARLEQVHGVRATYYFRVTRGVFREEIITAIAGLGHEVGYHYEVMDKSRGEPREALRIFTAELKRLRALAEILTVCMHGNPLSSYDNRAFWSHFELSQFGLVGEAYLSVKDSALFYVTDTGRRWNSARHNVKDRFPPGAVRSLPAPSSTWQLIEDIGCGAYKRIYMQIHPNRWSGTRLQWGRQWAEDLCLNVLKRLLSHGRGRKSEHESAPDQPSLQHGGQIRA